MKRWLIVALAGIALLMACAAPATEPIEPPAKPKTDLPTLTTEQVVSAIFLYGVPYINHYLKEAGHDYYYRGTFTPTGQWAASYEGDGHWRVQGAVLQSYKLIERTCSTTWTFTEGEDAIAIANMSCE